MAARAPNFYIADVTVPRQRIPDVVGGAREIAARHGLELVLGGHAGDGNVHPIMLYTDAQRDDVKAAASEMAALGITLGGTLTGEHGVGTDKRDYMYHRFTSAELAAFRSIKRAFDPGGILNSEVLLPPPTSDEPSLPTLVQQVSEAIRGWRAEPGPITHETDTRIEIDRENLAARFGGAVTCQAARDALTEVGLATAGLDGDGTVAEAVAGSGHQGDGRAALLGIASVLRDGPPARFGGPVMKDVAGLDAKRLVAGSAGGFGSIEDATFRLRAVGAEGGW